MRAAIALVWLAACGARAPEPSEPTSNGLSLGPDTHDLDGDDLHDADDRCPCAAEDDDDFEDTDGCPDLDDDRDTIPDACDLCPNEVEVWNGQDDGDGCRDTALPQLGPRGAPIPAPTGPTWQDRCAPPATVHACEEGPFAAE